MADSSSLNVGTRNMKTVKLWLIFPNYREREGIDARRLHAAYEAMRRIWAWYWLILGRGFDMDLSGLITTELPAGYLLDPSEGGLTAKTERLIYKRNPAYLETEFVNICLVKDGGAFAGAYGVNVGHRKGMAGWVGLGEACWQALMGNSESAAQISGLNPAYCTVNAQTGALAHELGHALGLPEVDRRWSRLMSWGYVHWPYCKLNKSEIQKLLATGFFNVTW